MKVTIWSTVGGKASGHIIFDVSPSDKISTLIKLYCKRKGDLDPCKYVLQGRNLLDLDPDQTVKEACIIEGDFLTLTISDKKDRVFTFSHWWHVSVIALIIGIVGSSYIFYVFFSPSQITRKYSIVIDAGSSHSQLFLFSWDGEKPQGTAEDINLVDRCFIPGGVASYKSNPQDLNSYLSPCLKKAAKNIPIISQPQTKLFFVATAGMRILRDFDPEGAYGLLSRIREILLRHTNFDVPHKNIFIASGRVEGISGWTAINYLLGTLIQDEVTSAVLDLGGASMQLSREFNDSTKWQTTNLTLFNTVRTVYSHTFLCYGLTEARHRHNFFLVKKFPVNKTLPMIQVLEEPCMAAGQELLLTPLDFDVPCTLNTSLPQSDVLLQRGSRNTIKFLQKYVTTSNSKDEYQGHINNLVNDYVQSFVDNTTDVFQTYPNETIYKVIGTSNALKCEQKITLLFDENICKNTFKYGNCLHKDKVPNFRKELVAFSDVFTLLLPLFGVNESTTLTQYHDNLMEICSYNFTMRKTKFQDLQYQLVDDLCFDGMYIYKLLTDGLGINEETWNNIDFTNKIQKNEVDWALGFIVNKTTVWPSEDPQPSIQFMTFILLIILFCSFILCGICIAHHAFMIGRRSCSYQRVIDHHIKHKLLGP